MYKLLLFAGFIFSFSSCSQVDNYTIPIQDVLHLNQCYQKSAEIIHQVSQAQLLDLEIETAYKPQYQAILRKAKIVEQQTLSVYDSLTLFYQHIINFPLENQASLESITSFQALQQKAIDLQKKMLRLFAATWENGGIKGTIFCDSSKRQEYIQRMEEYLSPIFLLPQGQYLNNRLLNEVGMLQQKIKQSESVFIHFLVAQTSKLRFCGSGFYIATNSSKSSIRLGETYETAITLLQEMPHDNYEVRVEDRILKMPDGISALFNIPTQTKGEQKFSVSVLIENPISKEQISLRKPFYFEVTR